MATVSKKTRRLMTSPLLVSLSSAFVGMFVKGLFSTMRLRFVVDDPACVPHKRSMPGIYIFWHEMLLLPAYSHAKAFTTLVSQSHDGELAAEVLRRFGGNVIRGSTTHGRLEAFRQLCRQLSDHHIAIAADGPRGPARVVPVGVVRAASVTGKPIVPIGMAYEKCLMVGPQRARVGFPRPFSRAWMVAGSPVAIPPISRLDRDDYRQQVQSAIDAVQARAERLAAGQDQADKSFSLKEVRAF
jgi:3-deoxy-D-manno-octulosonic-acid transferase